MTTNLIWNGTFAHLPFEEQVRATRHAGFDALSVTPADVARHVTQGTSAKVLRQIAADGGVRLAHLDPLATWAPGWQLPGMTKNELAPLSTPVDEFIDLAHELGCESFTAISTAAPHSVATGTFVEAFGRLCERAPGLRVDLEFIPTYAVPDLTMAWDVVEQAGAVNGGIMVDFWHFFRGNPDYDVLEMIPAEKLHSVQVCDARLTKSSGRTDLQDMLEDRLPLGWGEFPAEGLLKALARKGALGVVGPEYYSNTMRTLSTEQISDNLAETYWPRVSIYGVMPAT